MVGPARRAGRARFCQEKWTARRAVPTRGASVGVYEMSCSLRIDSQELDLQFQLQCLEGELDIADESNQADDKRGHAADEQQGDSHADLELHQYG